MRQGIGMGLFYLFVLTNSELFRQDTKFIFRFLTTLMSFSLLVCSFNQSAHLKWELACPQFTSAAVSLQCICSWFPSALNSSYLQTNAALHPAPGCSLSPIHMGMWVPMHRLWKGIPHIELIYENSLDIERSWRSLWKYLPRILNSSSPLRFCLLCSYFRLLFLPLLPCSCALSVLFQHPLQIPFQTRSVEIAKSTPNCPTAKMVLSAWSLPFDRNIKS